MNTSQTEGEMAAKAHPGTPEVERKFEVVESTVSPSFEGLAAVARVRTLAGRSSSMRSTSTRPDHDLAAHRDHPAPAHRRHRRGLAPEAARRARMPAPRFGCRSATERRRGARRTARRRAGDRPGPAAGRGRPHRDQRAPSTCSTDADGVALAEFCDDQVTASARGPTSDEQRWREWELELVERRRRDRPRPAGPADQPAARRGRGARRARLETGPGAGRRRRTDAEKPLPPADPVHRAVAEQVDELLEWDRAVRADAYDSVHQMRVTTRKIRSLLQASEESFGISDDAWVLDELRQLAAILGVARDAEVLAETLRAGARRAARRVWCAGRCGSGWSTAPSSRYEAGLRRSLVAMRSERYFRLLDALEGLVARGAAAPPRPARSRRRSPSTRRTGGCARPRRTPQGRRRRTATRRCTESARAPSDFATPRRRPATSKVSERAKTIQTLLGDHQDSVVSRTHLSQQAEAAHAAGEDTFTYGLLYQLEDDLARRSREQLDEALKKLRPVGAQEPP